MSSAPTYQPLNAPEDETRFVRIQNAEGSDDDIRCTIWTERLDSSGSYRALSYAWGSAAIRSSIILNNIRVAVPGNLAAALKCLRALKYVNVPFWIDAICINQEDDVEKGHQVRKMGQIFKSATEVLAWLGQQDISNEIHAILANRNNSRFSQLALSTKVEVRQVLRKIMTQTWWTRRWIIQEAVLAKKLMFVVGDKPTLSWSKLQAAYRRWLSKDVGDLNVFDRARTISTIRSQYGGGQRTRGNITLWDLLCQCRGRFHATLPVDIVYALLGLASDAGWIEPDYNKSLREVSKEIVLQRQSATPRSLEFLKDCESGPGPDYTLPTWVPAWDRELRTVIYHHNCEEISEELICAHHTFTEFVVDEQASVLNIQGVILDEVVERRHWKRDARRVRGKSDFVRSCICSKAVLDGDLICWFRSTQALVLRHFLDGFVIVGPCAVQEMGSCWRGVKDMLPRQFRIY